MNELLRALRPVKNRIRRNRMLRGAAAGFIPGAAAALALMAVTAFVPLENRWWIAGLALAGGVLLCAAVNAVRPVKDAEAARTADACGLRERTVTALEMADREPAEGKAAEIAEAQRKDACEHLQHLDVREIRLKKIPKRWILTGAGLLILCAGTLLIPGGGDRILAERKALTEKTAQMIRQIDEAAAAEEAGADEKEKAELRKLTEDLKRDLEKSRDDVDAMVALDKAEERLEEIRRKTAGDAQNELADALRNAGLDALANALENGDTAGVNEALAEISASGEAEKLVPEGLSDEAREMAEQLAEAAKAGSVSEEQMQAMSAGTKGGSAQSGALEQALAGMKASLGNSGMKADSGNSQTAGSSGTGNSGDQNGGGAGTGSTNTEQQGGGNRSGSGSRGSRPPEYKEGEYETIYDPEKAETVSRDVMTEQNKLGEDSVQIETGPGKGRLEGDVPYREVIGEYAQTEVQAAESAHLTQEQKEWVDEYFRRLTDE